MPIYEYECEKCSTTFEAMQAISARPLKNCNKSNCKGKVHRLVSASGFILKGSGWYTSDYPSEARKKGWESEGQNATASSNTNTENDTSNEKPLPLNPKQQLLLKKSPLKRLPKNLFRKTRIPGVKNPAPKPPPKLTEARWQSLKIFTKIFSPLLRMGFLLFRPILR